MNEVKFKKSGVVIALCGLSFLSTACIDRGPSGTVPLSLENSPSGNQNSSTVTFTYPRSVVNPDWLAFQDGPEGSWELLAENSDLSSEDFAVYTAEVSDEDGKYSYAYHQDLDGSGSSVSITRTTLTEQPSVGEEVTAHKVSGNLTSSALSDSTFVAIGGGSATPDVGTNSLFEITAVQGISDLVAVQATSTFVADKLYIERDVNVDKNISGLSIDLVNNGTDLNNVIPVTLQSSAAGSINFVNASLATKNNSIVGYMYSSTDNTSGNIILPSSGLIDGDRVSYKASNMTLVSNINIYSTIDAVTTSSTHIDFDAVQPLDLASISVDQDGIHGLSSYSPSSSSPDIVNYSVDLGQNLLDADQSNNVFIGVSVSSGWLEDGEVIAVPDLHSIENFDSSWFLKGEAATVNVSIVMATPNATFFGGAIGDTTHQVLSPAPVGNYTP